MLNVIQKSHEHVQILMQVFISLISFLLTTCFDWVTIIKFLQLKEKSEASQIKFIFFK